MNLQDIKAQIKVLETKAYNLKTKKAKKRAWDQIRELRSQALDILYAAVASYGPQSLKATVRYARPGEDYYPVDTEYGLMWLSPTQDVQSKSWYAHTCCIEYTKGQTIIMEFKTEVNSEKLFLEIIPGKVTGGTVNEAQYAELDKRTDLAFFKHSNAGGHVTGLFAK